MTLIGRREHQECGWLQLSVGQVQTALSSHERVIITGKSLHDQREPGLCQICAALENFGERREVRNGEGMMERKTEHRQRERESMIHTGLRFPDNINVKGGGRVAF